MCVLFCKQKPAYGLRMSDWSSDVCASDLKDRMAYSKDLGIDPHPGLTIGVVQLSPRSRGRLHIASPDANIAPRIYPDQFEDEEDIRVLTSGIRIARPIASQAALARFVVTELRPGTETASDDGKNGRAAGRGRVCHYL